MKKEEKILDKLLIFMKQEIAKEGSNLRNRAFNFKPSKVVQYFNAPEEIIPDGKDLAAFKKLLNIKEYHYIIMALNKAITEGYIQDMFRDKYESMILTELGSARAESARLNKTSIWKIIKEYFLDKIIIPILVAVTVAVITGHFMQQNLKEDVRLLKQEVEWIRQLK